MFNSDSFNPKYIKLYEYYKNLILSGVMVPNEKLPSIRKCSENFSLSRTTVETAYDLLSAEGYIISKAQSGFYVCDVDLRGLKKVEIVDNKLKNEKEKIKFDFVSSSADKLVFNFSVWRKYVKSALRQDERLLYYGEPQGESDLREAICNYVNKERGVVSTPSQIVIAAGTQNLIGILCAITKERKNVAFVGSDFRQGRAVFEDYGKTVSFNETPVEQLESLKDFSPSIIYTSPSHINKDGGVLQLSGRMSILSFALENQSLIIEDDYDSEFRYYSKSALSLQGLSGGQNTVYIGTFSKLLLPSIRISFMVLPFDLLEEYEKRKSLYNQTASKVEQIALCQYIRDGHLSSQIRKQRKHYISKRREILKRADKVLPESCSFEECEACYQIKIKISTSKTAEEISSLFLENSVKLKPLGEENGQAVLLMSVAGFNMEMLEEAFSAIIETIKMI